MAIEIYWGSGSPFAWRVLLALEIKQLPYQSRLIEFSKKGHKTPEFLKMNPRGKVPTLTDGDYVVYESIAILQYLDRKYPQIPLFGTTPEQAGAINQDICEVLAYIEKPIGQITRPLFSGEVAGKETQIREAAEALHQEFDQYEARLKHSQWLRGDRISASDITLYPSVTTILRAAGKPVAKAFDLGFLPLAQCYPNLTRWSAAIESLPGYARTYPPHWRQ
ncbi:MAG TPA: glutathione S-transferase family protein [Gammaproteobacteria bacterium]|nr:glutathione S-transferase family protein [Gammaproteobacteria bacterium]